MNKQQINSTVNIHLLCFNVHYLGEPAVATSPWSFLHNPHVLKENHWGCCHKWHRFSQIRCPSWHPITVLNHCQSKYHLFCLSIYEEFMNPSSMHDNAITLMSSFSTVLIIFFMKNRLLKWSLTNASLLLIVMYHLTLKTYWISFTSLKALSSKFPCMAN